MFISMHADRSMVNIKFSVESLCLLYTSSRAVMWKSICSNLHVGLHVEETCMFTV